MPWTSPTVDLNFPAIDGGLFRDHKYSVNNPFDPDVDIISGDKSAAYYTTLAAFYSELVCYGSRIRVKFYFPTATSQTNYVCGIRPVPVDTTTFPANGENLMTMGRWKWRTVISPGPSSKAVETTISMACSVAQLFGIKDPDDNNSMRAAVFAAPLQNANWQVVVYKLLPAGGWIGVSDFVRLAVDINYDVKWTSPKNTLPL